MKVYCVCELDVGDFSNIVHGCYPSPEDAKKAIKDSEGAGCEVPLYVMQADVDSDPPIGEWHKLHLTPYE